MRENAMTQLSAELEKLILEYTNLKDVGMDDRTWAQVTNIDERVRISQLTGHLDGLRQALNLVTAALKSEPEEIAEATHQRPAALHGQRVPPARVTPGAG